MKCRSGVIRFSFYRVKARRIPRRKRPRLSLANPDVIGSILAELNCFTLAKEIVMARSKPDYLLLNPKTIVTMGQAQVPYSGTLA